MSVYWLFMKIWISYSIPGPYLQEVKIFYHVVCLIYDVEFPWLLITEK